MKWYEIIIMVIAIILVIYPIISHIVKVKKKTVKCECGHLRSQCLGNCNICDTFKTNNNLKNKYILNVKGMKCGMCESHINDLIRNNFDVCYVKSYKNSDTTVIVSEKELKEDMLINIITKAGYDVTNIRKVV